MKMKKFLCLAAVFSFAFPFGGVVATLGNCDDSSQCPPDATCVSPNTPCTCNDGFHLDLVAADSCVQDIAVDEACTQENSDIECADPNANCTKSADLADELKCRCKAGFHKGTGTVDNPATCMEDIAAGQPCTIENSETECIDFATCKNAQEGDVSLTCICNDGYHEVDSNMHTQGNKTICAADTCRHTVDKCSAAGNTTCAELNAFIGCLLSGACSSTDPEEVSVFDEALKDIRPILPADCVASGSTTCGEKLTGCLFAQLKGAINMCTVVNALGSCVNSAKPTCDGETDAGTAKYDLAMAYFTHMSNNLSCVCLEATSACTTAQETNYNNAVDTTTKCSATKELFSCAFTDKCDLNKSIDHDAVKDVWAQAMDWARATGCKDSLTEETATTCPLQLTRCALVYTQNMAATGNDTFKTCRVAEEFNACLTGSTTACTDADGGVKQLFTDQYTLTSAACSACINGLNKCYDDIGVLTSDPVVACPKLARYAQCTTTVECDMRNAVDWEGLKTVHKWYLDTKENNSCSVTSDHTCLKDAEVCSDTFINAVSTTTVSTEEICSATVNNTLCVYAANCSSDASDATVVNSTRKAGLFKLKSLSCSDLDCNATRQELEGCKKDYDSEFQTATSDDNKCTAKNNMVKCLRTVFCNPYMKGLVQNNYNTLTSVTVTGCEMLPLEDKTSSAPSPHTAGLVLLTTFIAGILAARL